MQPGNKNHFINSEFRLDTDVSGIKKEKEKKKKIEKERRKKKRKEGRYFACPMSCLSQVSTKSSLPLHCLNPSSGKWVIP